jgi:hypothetical protein
MEANGCRLENSGMSLLDLDTGHRAIAHKEKAVSSTNSLKVPDYPSTRAAPSRTDGKELVVDPLKEVKLQATQGEAVVAGTAAREQADRPFGSQIKVSDQLFMLMDEPDLCAQLTAPKAALQMVGALGDTLLMTPQANPNQFLLQYTPSKMGSGVQPSLWMEQAVAAAHMKGLLTKPLASGAPAPLDAAAAGAMAVDELFKHYDQLRLSGAR